MAYRFITPEDYDAQIYSGLLRDEDNPALVLVLEQIEQKAIAIISSRLTGRYDLDRIWDAEEADRNYMIVHYTITIVVFMALRRNAARKVPSDIKEDYEKVMADLDKIMAGKLTPVGLPLILDSEGAVSKKPITANRKNNNFYI
jgi:phage gp36-like protein